MKGIDNTCIPTASQPATVGESGTTKVPAPRRASRRHPLAAAAVRAAEEALEAAIAAEARAIERNEDGNISHGDEAWDNEQAVFDAIDRREQARKILCVAEELHT